MTYLTNTTAKTRTQIGSLENDYHLIVELIDGQQCPAVFLDWISNSSYSKKLIHHQTTDSKHLRIYTFHVENVLVYTARAEFNLGLISDQAMGFLRASQNNEKLLMPKDFGLTFASINKVVADPYYNIISYIVENNEVVGMLWEIYELPELAQIYSKKSDPLRYWKMERRE